MDILTEVEKLVDTLFAEEFTINLEWHHEVKISANDLGYHFQWDNRSKNRLGCCRYTRKQINLSSIYVMNNFHENLDDIEDTIRHEIAHAISYHMDRTRGRGHGDMWKRVAEQVGAKPNRCKGDIVFAESKWTMICPNDECRRKTHYHRKSKHSKACGSCCKKYNGGKYDEQYKLVAIQNY